MISNTLSTITADFIAGNLANGIDVLSLSVTLRTVDDLPAVGRAVFITVAPSSTDTLVYQGGSIIAGLTDSIGRVTAQYTTTLASIKEFTVAVDEPINKLTISATAEFFPDVSGFLVDNPFVTNGPQDLEYTISGKEITLVSDPNNNGAITELWWEGIQLLNFPNKTRGLQYYSREVENDTIRILYEGGTAAEAIGDTSSGRFIGSVQNPRQFLTQGFAPYAEPVAHGSDLLECSGDILTKQVYMDYIGNPNIVRIDNEVEHYSSVRNGTRVWGLSLALSQAFTHIYSYRPDQDPEPVAVLEAVTGGDLSTTYLGGVIAANSAGSIAVGVFHAPRKVGNTFSTLVQKPGAPQAGDVKEINNHCLILDTEAAPATGAAAGITVNTRYLCVGSLESVTEAFAKLDAYIRTGIQSGSSGGSTDPIVAALAVRAAPAVVEEEEAFSIVIEAVNSSDIIVPTYEGACEVTVQGNTSAISGDTTLSFVAGSCTFTDLVLDTPGNHILLVTSGTFVTQIYVTVNDIGPDPTVVVALSVDTAPSVINQNQAFTVVVEAVNYLNEAVPTYELAATIAVLSGGAVITGNTVVPFVEGVATFDNLEIATPGSYVLAITSSTFTTVTFITVNVVNNDPVVTEITVRSAPTVVGLLQAFNVVVLAVDAFGAVVTNYTLPAQITAQSSPGVLIGGTSTTFVAGVATFSNLQLTNVANYTLVITSGGFVDSTPVQVNNPIPVLTSISPTTTSTAQTTPLIITATGSSFRPSSRVRLDGVVLPTTFVSATSLTAVIAPTLLTQGTHSVSVITGSPGGGISASRNFVVTDGVAPIISDINIGVTQTEALVSWNTNEPSPTEIRYYREVPVGQTPTIVTYLDPTLYLSHAASLSNLAAGDYSAFIYARDSVGNERVSDRQSWNIGDFTPPIISNVLITNVTASQARIRWSTDDLCTCTIVYSGGLLVTVPPGTPSNTFDIVLQQLTAATAYTFQIVARNQAGVTTPYNGDFSTNTIPDTQPPLIDFGPIVSDITPASARITWSLNEAGTGIVNYGTVSGSLTQVSGPTPGYSLDHNPVLFNLINGTTYYYRVSGADQAGNVYQSNELSFVTAPPTTTGSLNPDDEVARISIEVPEGKTDGDTFICHCVIPVLQESDLGIYWSAQAFAVGSTTTLVGSPVTVQREWNSWKNDHTGADGGTLPTTNAVECIFPITIPAGVAAAAKNYCVSVQNVREFSVVIKATLAPPAATLVPPVIPGALNMNLLLPNGTTQTANILNPANVKLLKSGPYCVEYRYYNRLTQGGTSTLGVHTYVMHYPAATDASIYVRTLITNSHVVPSDATTWQAGSYWNDPNHALIQGKRKYGVVGKIYFDELSVDSSTTGLHVAPRHLSRCMSQVSDTNLKLVAFMGAATDTGRLNGWSECNPSSSSNVTVPIYRSYPTAPARRSEMWVAGGQRVEHLVLHQPAATVNQKTYAAEVLDYQNVAWITSGRNWGQNVRWYGPAYMRSSTIPDSYETEYFYYRANNTAGNTNCLNTLPGGVTNGTPHNGGQLRGRRAYDKLRMEQHTMGMKYLRANGYVGNNQDIRRSWGHAHILAGNWGTANNFGCWTPGWETDGSTGGVVMMNMYEMDFGPGHTSGWSYFLDSVLERHYITQFHANGEYVTSSDWHAAFPGPYVFGGLTTGAPGVPGNSGPPFPVLTNTNANSRGFAPFFADTHSPRSVHRQPLFNTATCIYDHVGTLPNATEGYIYRPFDQFLPFADTHIQRPTRCSFGLVRTMNSSLYRDLLRYQAEYLLQGYDRRVLGNPASYASPNHTVGQILTSLTPNPANWYEGSAWGRGAGWAHYVIALWYMHCPLDLRHNHVSAPTPILARKEIRDHAEAFHQACIRAYPGGPNVTSSGGNTHSRHMKAFDYATESYTSNREDLGAIEFLFSHSASVDRFNYHPYTESAFQNTVGTINEPSPVNRLYLSEPPFTAYDVPPGGPSSEYTTFGHIVGVEYDSPTATTGRLLIWPSNRDIALTNRFPAMQSGGAGGGTLFPLPIEGSTEHNNKVAYVRRGPFTGDGTVTTNHTLLATITLHQRTRDFHQRFLKSNTLEENLLLHGVFAMAEAVLLPHNQAAANNLYIYTYEYAKARQEHLNYWSGDARSGSGQYDAGYFQIGAVAVREANGSPGNRLNDYYEQDPEAPWVSRHVYNVESTYTHFALVCAAYAQERLGTPVSLSSVGISEGLRFGAGDVVGQGSGYVSNFATKISRLGLAAWSGSNSNVAEKTYHWAPWAGEVQYLIAQGNVPTQVEVEWTSTPLRGREIPSVSNPISGVTIRTRNGVTTTQPIVVRVIPVGATGLYSMPATLHTIPAGSTAVNVPVSVLPNTTHTGNQVLTLTLAVESGPAIVNAARNTLNITIVDDDPLSPPSVEFSTTTTVAYENQAARNITVRSSYPINTPLVVRILRSGTATPAVDYTLANIAVISSIIAQLTIPANQTAATFSISASPDSLSDGGETVIFTIAADPAYVVGTNSVHTTTLSEISTPGESYILAARLGTANGVITTPTTVLSNQVVSTCVPIVPPAQTLPDYYMVHPSSPTTNYRCQVVGTRKNYLGEWMNAQVSCCIPNSDNRWSVPGDATNPAIRLVKGTSTTSGPRVNTFTHLPTVNNYKLTIKLANVATPFECYPTQVNHASNLGTDGTNEYGTSITGATTYMRRREYRGRFIRPGVTPVGGALIPAADASLVVRMFVTDRVDVAARAVDIIIENSACSTQNGTNGAPLDSPYATNSTASGKVYFDWIRVDTGAVPGTAGNESIVELAPTGSTAFVAGTTNQSYYLVRPCTEMDTDYFPIITGSAASPGSYLSRTAQMHSLLPGQYFVRRLCFYLPSSISSNVATDIVRRYDWGYTTGPLGYLSGSYGHTHSHLIDYGADSMSDLTEYSGQFGWKAVIAKAAERLTDHLAYILDGALEESHYLSDKLYGWAKPRGFPEPDEPSEYFVDTHPRLPAWPSYTSYMLDCDHEIDRHGLSAFNLSLNSCLTDLDLVNARSRLVSPTNPNSVAKRMPYLFIAGEGVEGNTGGTGVFREVGGRAVIEVESMRFGTGALAADRWVYTTTATTTQNWNGTSYGGVVSDPFTGTGYYVWNGPARYVWGDIFTGTIPTVSPPGFYATPGTTVQDGLIYVDVEITTPGTYNVFLRNRHDGANQTEENDIWIRSISPTGVATIFYKMFSNGIPAGVPFYVGRWAFESTFEVFGTPTTYPVATFVLPAGVTRIELQGRSPQFKIDRLHLVHSSVGVTHTQENANYNLPETPVTGTSLINLQPDGLVAWFSTVDTRQQGTSSTWAKAPTTLPWNTPDSGKFCFYTDYWPNASSYVTIDHGASGFISPATFVPSLGVINAPRMNWHRDNTYGPHNPAQQARFLGAVEVPYFLLNDGPAKVALAYGAHAALNRLNRYQPPEGSELDNTVVRNSFALSMGSSLKLMDITRNNSYEAATRPLQRGFWYDYSPSVRSVRAIPSPQSYCNDFSLIATYYSIASDATRALISDNGTYTNNTGGNNWLALATVFLARAITSWGMFGVSSTADELAYSTPRVSGGPIVNPTQAEITAGVGPYPGPYRPAGSSIPVSNNAPSNIWYTHSSPADRWPSAMNAALNILISMSGANQLYSAPWKRMLSYPEHWATAAIPRVVSDTLYPGRSGVWFPAIQVTNFGSGNVSADTAEVYVNNAQADEAAYRSGARWHYWVTQTFKEIRKREHYAHMAHSYYTFKKFELTTGTYGNMENAAIAGFSYHGEPIETLASTLELDGSLDGFRGAVIENELLSSTYDLNARMLVAYLAQLQATGRVFDI